MFIPVFVEFLRIGLVNHFPTLFVSCFIELAAVQAFFSGMILSDLAKKNRRDFEFQLNQVHRQKRKTEYDKEKDSITRDSAPRLLPSVLSFLFF